MKNHDIGSRLWQCFCLVLVLSFPGCALKNSLLAVHRTVWEMEVRLMPNVNVVDGGEGIFAESDNLQHEGITGIFQPGAVLVYRFEQKWKLDEFRGRFLNSGLITGMKVTQINY